MKQHLLHLALAITAVFAPEAAAIGTVLVLIGADLVTGLLAARKSGQPITSAGLRRTITKVFIYEAALMAAYLAQKYLMEDALPLAKIVSSFIGLTEFKSISENLNILSGNSLLSSLIDKLGSVNEKGGA